MDPAKDADPPKIEEIDSDDDDMPPPLEDMSSTIKLRDRLNKKPDPAKTKGARRETKKAPEPAKPQKTPEEGAWVGKTVELFGLSAKQYNGQQGIAASFLEEAVRYAVKLESGKSLKVRPANLKVIETVGGMSKGFFKPADDDDDVEVISPKDPTARPGQLPEIAAKMKEANDYMQENQKDWCTPELLNKLAKNPEMMEMMGKPQFMAAIGEFQKDPAAAKKKYEGSPQVMKFFTDFCGIMGEHLTGLQDTKDAQAKKTGGGGGDAGVDRQMITPAAKSEEDVQIEAILAKPEVQEALQDPRVMNIMKVLRENPEKGKHLLHESMRDPTLLKRIQVLVQNKLLGLA